MGREGSEGMRVVSLLLFCVIGVAFSGATKLPSLGINVDRVTTSGVSSGACMATQLHVSWSSMVQGVGMIAGVPYYCGRSNVASALSCTEFPSAVDVDCLLFDTSFAESTLSIDDTKNMRNA